MKFLESPDKTKSLRLFYALWPDETTRAALARLQIPIRGRKTRYRNLHLTLAFLGEQPSALVRVLHEILTRLPTAQIPMVLDQVGYFPKKQIAWAGMHPVPDALADLQQQLVKALAQQGIICSPDFKPHVTLARHAQAPDDFHFPPIQWIAKQIVLVHSTRDAEGIFYRVL
jgi:2'-5' RNA ligase